MMHTAVIGGILALSLTACAAMAPQRATTLSPAGAAVVVCESEADCDRKWQRAAAWIRRHSDWPIRTRTADRIETDQARFRGYHRTYYRVTRIPAAAGRATIVLDANCLPSVHCSPDPGWARAAFVRFVSTGENAGAGQQ